MENSNKSLIAILIVGAVCAVLFFTLIQEKQNQYSMNSHASFNGAKGSSAVEGKTFGAASANISSTDITVANMPTYTKGSSSAANNSGSSAVDFPSSGVSQVDVQNVSSVQRSHVSTNLSTQTSSAQYMPNVASEIAYSTTNAQNPIKSDIAEVFELNARVENNIAGQGSKRTTKTIGAKTATVIAVAAEKGPKKVGEDPIDPVTGGASLPVGDGVWVMLMLVAAYGVSLAFRVSRFSFRV